VTDLLLIAVWALVSAICFALKNIYVKIYTNQRRIEDLHKRLETPNIPSVWTETPTEYTEPKEVIRKLICDNERMDMLLKNMKIRAENMLLTLEVHKVG